MKIINQIMYRVFRYKLPFINMAVLDVACRVLTDVFNKSIVSWDLLKH